MVQIKKTVQITESKDSISKALYSKDFPHSFEWMRLKYRKMVQN